MANHNPFNNSSYDLGIGDEYGYDMDSATDNLLRTAYTHVTTCTVCQSNNVEYRLIPKKDSLNTHDMQKGVYICSHCVSKGAIDKELYGIRPIRSS